MNQASTGMPDLDLALNGGIESGSVVWIVGRPASGKSKLLSALIGTLAGPATLFDVEKLHALTIDQILVKAVDAQAWTGMKGAPTLIDNISMAKLTPGTTYADRSGEQRQAMLRLAASDACAVICTSMAPRDSMPSEPGLMKISKETQAGEVTEHYVQVKIGQGGSFESLTYLSPVADFETPYEARASLAMRG